MLYYCQERKHGYGNDESELIRVLVLYQKDDQGRRTTLEMKSTPMSTLFRICSRYFTPRSYPERAGESAGYVRDRQYG